MRSMSMARLVLGCLSCRGAYEAPAPEELKDGEVILQIPLP